MLCAEDLLGMDPLSSSAPSILPGQRSELLDKGTKCTQHTLTKALSDT